MPNLHGPDADKHQKPAEGRLVVFPEAYPGNVFRCEDSEWGIFHVLVNGKPRPVHRQVNTDATPWEYADGLDDLPEGYRWATELEMDDPEAISVPRTFDSAGNRYDGGVADVAVPVAPSGLKRVTISITLTLDTGELDDRTMQALHNLAAVMAVQAEDGLYDAGSPDIDEYVLDGQDVTSEYVCGIGDVQTVVVPA